MFGEEETFGINGKGEYNQQFHGFTVWMDPILKFVRSNFKQLAKLIPVTFCEKISNSSTDQKNEVAYNKKNRVEI